MKKERSTSVQEQRVYLDHASTTPVADFVLDAMRPYWSENFGNPSSLSQEGISARKALEDARARIARVLGCRGTEIVFTSGGTEANVLALRGVVTACKKDTPYVGNGMPHIVTTNIEHSSILETCGLLQGEGVSVDYVGADKEGLIPTGMVSAVLRPNTVLVSLAYVNSEIGTVQPIKDIARVIKQYREEKKNGPYPLLHIDASQAPLWLSLQSVMEDADLLTIDAHKMYGPKGIGFLVVGAHVPLAPLFAGTQERGLRAGTEPVSLVVGLAEAFCMAQKKCKKEAKRIGILRDYLVKEFKENVPDLIVNGSMTKRVANNSNITVPHKDAELLALLLDKQGIAVSTKSACGNSRKESHVLRALHGDALRNEGALRCTLGYTTTKEDIDYTVKCFAKALQECFS